MANLAKELEDLHAAVVARVKEKVEFAEDLNNDDLRVAMQLLKQNSISANLSENLDVAQKAALAAKLNFDGLQAKVVPIGRQNRSASA